MAIKSDRLRRFLLPGLAFKAVVIGGGYATGREMASFFLPSGPVGGLYAIALATAIWSVVCMATFAFAVDTRSFDYRTFFGHLLGPAWPIYEIAYFLALIVILAVFAAAAGAISRALFGLPEIAGASVLMLCIALCAAWGNNAVEQLFKYVSLLLYGTYVAFVLLGFTHFGDRIAAAFASPASTHGWFPGGLTYAGYNIIGAIVILPVTRHLTTRRDAMIAGAIAGPLAMLPALLFFVCMAAYYPAIGNETLPSDFLLEQLDLPWFRYLFQFMIFAALLESGTGGVHAINERIAQAHRERHAREISPLTRFAITIVILGGSIFAAGRFGLVALIAEGYRWLAYTFLLIYVLPLFSMSIFRAARTRSRRP